MIKERCYQLLNPFLAYLVFYRVSFLCNDDGVLFPALETAFAGLVFHRVPHNTPPSEQGVTLPVRVVSPALASILSLIFHVVQVPALKSVLLLVVYVAVYLLNATTKEYGFHLF